MDCQQQRTFIWSREIKKHPDAWPEYISLLGLENIDYPPLFDPWDYHFKVSPSFSAAAWSVDFNDATYGDTHFQMQNFVVTLDGGLVFHSPLGALGVHVGIGPAYIDGISNHGDSYNKVTTVFKLGMQYTMFFHRIMYFKLSVDGYSYTENKKKPILINDTTLEGWHDVMIGIGYYFPSLRMKIRDALSY